MGAKSIPEPGSGTTGEKEDEEEEIEEGRCPHVLCEPCDPTVEQVRMHQLGAHLPFRNWCNACIAAKAKERDHSRPTKEEKENEESRRPTFGLDYAFFSEELILEGDEGKSSSSIKVASMKEKRTGWRSAHQVMRKGGGDEYTAQSLVGDVDTLGGGTRW